MTQKTTDEVKAPVAPAADAAPAPEAKTDDAPITRSEVVSLIAEGVAAALKAQAAPAAAPAEDVKRSDEAPANEDGSAKLLSSVESVAESVKGLAASVEAMTKRMDSMEGATVVRSDAPDAATSAVQRKDVFAGCFGRSQS